MGARSPTAMLASKKVSWMPNLLVRLMVHLITYLSLLATFDPDNQPYNTSVVVF